MKIRQNLDLNTCKNITTDCTAYKWWSTESTRSKHYFAINNLSALSIVSFLLTQNHFTDGNFLHLASFSIKLQGDTFFQDMNAIYFSWYLYIPPESHIKCQIKSEIIVPPYWRYDELGVFNTCNDLKEQFFSPGCILPVKWSRFIILTGLHLGIRTLPKKLLCGRS